MRSLPGAAVRCHPPEKAQSPTRIWFKDTKSPYWGAGGGVMLAGTELLSWMPQVSPGQPQP